MFLFLNKERMFTWYKLKERMLMTRGWQTELDRKWTVDAIYLDNHEHVVNTNSQQQERYDRMDGTVDDAKVEAQSIGSQNGLANHWYAQDWQHQLCGKTLNKKGF